MSDLIDRRAAIEKLRNNLTYMQVFGVDRSIVLINELPSAQPERIRGRWIDKSGGIATCSKCGDRWGVWSVMNYCPNCGADMREDDHEAD